MAAGTIQTTVTTTTGETIEQSFYVDETGAPTTYEPVVRIDSGQVTSTGQDTSANSIPVVIANDQSAVAIQGGVAHDGVDSGNPLKIGMRALAHGTNPTAVAAADRTDWLANRAGIPWVIGGHPNIITKTATFTTSQTDTALVTISTGSKIVVTQISAIVGAAVSVSTAVTIGFGTANTPTPSSTAVTGLIIDGTFSAGNGIQKGNGGGIIAIGADNEDLRITSGAPTSGSLFISFSYYTIES